MTKQGLQTGLAVACACVSLGAGCLGEDGGFGEGVDEDVEEVSSAVTVFPSSFESGTQYGKMWRWNVEGVNVVPLTSATTSACFLNSVWGSLAGNDYVAIVNTGGTWALQGTGADSSPSADAFCLLNVLVTPEIPALPDRIMALPGATATGHTCFITRVAGGWTSGTNEVKVEQKGTGWNLITKGVSASARCVNRPPLLETTWSGSGVIALHGDLTNPNMNTALNTSPTTRYFCSLTRITGILNGIGNGWIGTYNQPFGNGWQWYVGGKKNSIALPGLPSYTYPLSGAARCVQ